MTQLFAADGTVRARDGDRGRALRGRADARPKRQDGYDAVQLGLVEAASREERHQAAGGPLREGRPCRLPRAARVPGREGADALEGRRPGARWRACSTPATRVDVIGTSRGHGLPGRHEAAPLRAAARRPTARCSTARPGSIGASAYPVARHQGHAGARATWATSAVTTQNLDVVRVRRRAATC
ncbi:MAG: hypothetical protein MZV70_34305 [Desulfobacterales bacterium]|nr:hypothetical protein [Desulfobacterales bacterium]